MIDKELLKHLQDENTRLRQVGLNLAEAAVRVVRDYDGLHRLALEASIFLRAVACESGRGEKEQTSECPPSGYRKSIDDFKEFLWKNGYFDFLSPGEWSIPFPGEFVGRCNSCGEVYVCNAAEGVSLPFGYECLGCKNKFADSNPRGGA